MHVGVGIVISICPEQFHVMAGWAQTPIFKLGQSHINLIHFHSPLIRIEAVFWREL